MRDRIPSFRMSRIIALFALAWLPAGPWPQGRAAEPEPLPAPKTAVAPVAPTLPPDVLAAMQEKRYADAEKVLSAWVAAQGRTNPEKAYAALVRGVAARLAGKLDEAGERLREGLKAEPNGTWSAKLRFELAGVELAAGRASEAEQLARDEVETLLAGDRKDRLAGVYLAFARKLLEPEAPITPPDPAGAHQLLTQARKLAKGETLRAHLLFRMGRALQKAGNHGGAVGEFQVYLKEYPKGADRDAVRYHLGESQVALGQLLPARLTWTDLVRDLESADQARAKAAAELRARALYGIATTHGIPNPPDDTRLNLGVAALRRFLEAYPSHPLAVRAASQIAQSDEVRGKSQDALEAYRSFLKSRGFEASTDEARRERDTLMQAATYQVAAVLDAQGRYAEAIDAYKGYLAQFPNGPQSAAAQRAVLDVELKIAFEALRREEFEAARTAWQTFVNHNPLDPRVPQLLFQVGASFRQQKKFVEAISAWELLIGKFPSTEPASHAQFEIADITETEKGDPATAIEKFRKIEIDPWKSQAAQRIAVMESKALTVVTPRVFRSGETPHLKIFSRNLESLTFTAYKLAPETYFRKKHGMGNVEALDIGLVKPDAEWTVDVGGYAKYKPIETTYDLKEIKIPGVYVVKVTDEKTLQATTLVLGSDLDAVVKVSREQVLVFAQDMKTGKGRPGARVLVSDGSSVILESKTGEDGVLLTNWEKPRDVNAPLQYLVLDGANVAGSGLNVPDHVAQGLTPRAYLYTDRPAYRPGQIAELRGVVREVRDGQYAFDSGAQYKLEVTDSRGRLIVAKGIALSAFGTFSETVRIEEGAPVGTYRVRLYRPGQAEFSGGFEVQAYQLAKVDLSVDLPKTVYYRGETIEGSALARYQYGTPLAGRQIRVRLPDGRILDGRTDDAGKFAFKFETEGFAEEQILRIIAQLPQDNVAAVANAALAVQAFRIDLSTKRDVYIESEPFALDVTTLDARGEPTGQKLTVSVLKRVTQGGQTAEREVSKVDLTTDEKTGAGRATLKVEDAEGGSFVVRAAGTDRFGNAVVADRELTISGKADETKLRILADRTTFKVGETAKVALHNRAGKTTALLAWEADRVLTYKIQTIEPGENALSWAVEGPQFPNFTLTASAMAGDKFHEARLDVRVERDLRVSLTPKSPRVGPGEEVLVDVTTTDQNGKPVAAELSVALVDRALLRQFNDTIRPIGPFFYDQARTGAFSTESTNTFRYAPGTTAVSEAVVEDAERNLALEKDAKDRTRALESAGQLRNGVLFAAPGNAPAAVLATPAPMPPAAAEPADPTGVPREEYARRGAAGYGGMMGGGGGMPGGGMGGMGGRFGGAPGSRADVNIVDDYSSTIEGKELAELDAAMDKRKLGEGMEPELLARTQSAAKAGTLARSRGARPASPMTPRQQYVETAYWNPRVVTDAQGKALVRFKAPTALSEYRFTARGVTGADTLVGQATSELAVRKNFFVDLKLPSILTQGDKPRFLAQVHHAGVSGTLDVKLTVYAGGRQAVYPRQVEIKKDGVEDIRFDPMEVPEGDSVRLTLSARVGDSEDQLVTEVPIRPWGVQAFASASGSSSDDVTEFVGLPTGRAYESPEMLIVLSPTVRRMIFELALGRDFYRFDRRIESCILPPPTDAVADRASDLLAATSALAYLRTVRIPDAPEVGRLTDRIRGLASELVALQNQDGGWPWVPARTDMPQAAQRPSDRMTSSLAFWALASAEPLGLVSDPKVLDQGGNYLNQEFNKLEAGDLEARATVLHALSVRKKASFEAANALNRSRQAAPDAALGMLALTFVNLDRPSLANEVVDLLIARARTEAVAPGQKPRTYWSNAGPRPWHATPTEITAVCALAVGRARPQDGALSQAIDWIVAHRTGAGWQPHKAKGPALAALGTFHGSARSAEDRYRLTITVNDRTVATKEIQGSGEGEAVRVPRAALKPGDKNRVRFDIEGRGTFGYSVVLTGFTRDFGPDQNQANRPFYISRRAYGPGDPELDGRILPTGFSAAVNASYFENTVTQTGLGEVARVRIDAHRIHRSGQPTWDQDFLILEEYLPAGTSLVEGSVQTQASSYTQEDGVLTFYFAPDQYPGRIQYDVFGTVPGQYRALPPRLRSAYDPGRVHLGPTGDLKVRMPDEKGTDPYRATPDELLARGKALYEADRLAEASVPLEELFTTYTLRDEVARDVARMLLFVNIREYNPRKVVQYFEVLKEKAPDLEIPFEKILIVGRAYRDINEYERAYLVWRAIAEASYLEDVQVGEVLRQRGRALEGVAFLLDLWKAYPNTASIESDFFGLSQVLASLATRAINEAPIRREVMAAGLSRSDLLLQSIRLVQVLLTLAPTNPLADEASLSEVGAHLELEDFKSVVALSRRFAALYPKSTFLDSFQYSEALGRFNLGEYDRAIEVAQTIASATYKDANGVDQPSPNKWQAIYILGQIHDARRQPAQAIDYYRQVIDRFTDASAAVTSYTRKALKLAEVTVIRPTEGGAKEPKSSTVKLDYRNIPSVDVKVYPVDLMRLYLTRRSLDGIAGIDLAGITPLYEATVELGNGQDFEDKSKDLTLPLKETGAYLVMVRGENLYASGIALVSPLEMQVLEEPDAGRVRVTVRDAGSGTFVPKAQVKVIGTDNPTFLGGQTDLRGVVLTEGLHGQVTAVARIKTNEYAFFRGTTYVGQPPTPAKSEAPAVNAPGAPAQQGQALDDVLKSQNFSNQLRQIERLEQRYAPNDRSGVKVQEAR